MVSRAVFLVGTMVYISQAVEYHGVPVVSKALVLVPRRGEGEDSNYNSFGSSKRGLSEIEFVPLHYVFALSQFTSVWGLLGVLFEWESTNETSVCGCAGSKAIKLTPNDSSGWDTGY